MSKFPHPCGPCATDQARDELKSALEYIGEEDMSKNLNHAVLALCGRFLLGDRQLMISAERRKALQTLSLLLHVMNAAATGGKGSLRIDPTLTKCVTTLALSELRELCIETDNTISLLCDILHQSLLLMEEWERDELIMKISAECENSLEATISGETVTSGQTSFKPEASLRILEVALEFLANTASGKQSCELEDDCKSPVEDHSPLSSSQSIKLHQVFIHLVFSPHEGLSAHLLVILIPLLVKVEGSALFLRELWDAISASNSEDTDCRSLATLCALADFYLPVDRRIRSIKIFSIYDRTKFWRLLQDGVCAQQPLIRKQALYLLKRSIDGLVKNGKQINITEFNWNVAVSNKLHAAWQDLILVLEALEEAQAHLVRPVLGILGRHLNSYTKGTMCVQLPWLLCAFQRVLLHPSQSVCLWGIETLLSADGKALICGAEGQTFMRFVLKTLLPVLNSSTIFTSETGVSKALTSFLTETARATVGPSFFSQLLCSMAAMSWAPVPLYHVTEALSNAPATASWHGSDLTEVRKLVAITLATQSIVIRAATQSQLLTCVINLINTHHVELDSLCDLFSLFRREECLRRGTKAWSRVANWLSKCVDDAAAHDWLSFCGEDTNRYDASTARFVILLLDAGKLDNLEALRPVLKSVKDCESRLYASQLAQDGCVKLIAHLVQECSSIQAVTEKDKAKTVVINFVQDALADILTLYRIRLQCVSDISAFHAVSHLLQSLEVLIMDCTVLPLIIPDQSTQTLLTAALEVLKSWKEHPPLKNFFASSVLKLFSFAFQNFTHDNGSSKFIMESINILVTCGLLARPLILQRVSKLPQELLELQGHLVSAHTKVVWELLAARPDSLKDWDEEKLSVVLDAANNSLELGGRTALVPILRALALVLPNVFTTQQGCALQLLQRCWNDLLELRRNELFWPALDAFVAAVMQPVLVFNCGWAHKFALKCGHELISLGDSVCGVANVLVASLQSLADKSLENLLLSSLRELVLSALLFGPVHRKDQRAINDTCEHIASLGESCAANILSSHGERSDAGVRAGAAQILIQIGAGSEPWRSEVADQLITDLLDIDKKSELCRPRYFGDSQIHRSKHRVLQGILLLEPLLSLGRKQVLAVWAKDRLMNENHQPSVRYQTEWLLVRILSALPEERVAVWETFPKALELRAGAVCSLIGVVLHTVLMMECSVQPNKSTTEMETFLDSVFEALLPCTMAQHFNVRLHSQVAILQMWTSIERLALHTIQSRYEVVMRGVRSSLDQASGAGHTRHQHDFYFHAFHPSQHYSLQTIFEDLPRLSNVARDEWVTQEQLSLAGVQSGNRYLPLKNSNLMLQEFEPSPWVQRPASGNSAEMDESTKSSVFQKKMIPWKWMDPTEELLQSLPESLQQRKKCAASAQLGVGGEKSSLVVVASLIDKAPNLGGLARTCEILGASLVLPSLSCAQEREFKALSMSAEMWVPLCEVKPHQLPQFLTDMKSGGYSLLGAEQTAGSVPLNSAKFASHTVLILGNEREGIPAHLLPLLDQCVEVPQFGVIRSLNVHVTGALFMWEHACQHLLQLNSASSERNRALSNP